ncbi:aldo/keto reductase [Microbacterium arborescens]|uniref:aldo/keto reductase n=1 Tax=Microbacterium arborescens TaxID=33883 RepID=UPI0027808087|nr:aldo/keto reductase [Microbacterium arborescens]MDQ1217211.1 D-threo-aldose 1-dehydrogenase [Microbacterium arborescens]
MTTDVRSRSDILSTMGRWGLGTGPLGNLFAAIDDDEARQIVDATWDRGVRMFDTAPHYGLGLAERRLGDALRDRPRAEYVVSTKVGRLLVPNPEGASHRDSAGFDVPADLVRRWDFSARGVQESWEQSLERLGLDAVDILYLHDPEDHLDAALNEALPALVELREAGHVSAIGIGTTNVAAAIAVVETGLVDVAMIAGRYTLLDRTAAERLLPAALDHDVAVVAAGVYNSGILATARPGPGSYYDYAPAPAEVIARAARLAEVCAAHGVELPRAARAFALRHPAVVSVVLGIGDPSFVPGTFDDDEPLPDALWAELDA